jgi:hypothetical protein
MKRHFKKLTGHENDAMLGPIRMYAHIPKLLSGYGKLEQAVAKVHLLNLRHRALAELKAATTRTTSRDPCCRRCDPRASWITAAVIHDR